MIHTSIIFFGLVVTSRRFEYPLHLTCTVIIHLDFLNLVLKLIDLAIGTKLVENLL